MNKNAVRKDWNAVQDGLYPHDGETCHIIDSALLEVKRNWAAEVDNGTQGPGKTEKAWREELNPQVVAGELQSSSKSKKHRGLKKFNMLPAKGGSSLQLLLKRPIRHCTWSVQV